MTNLVKLKNTLYSSITKSYKYYITYVSLTNKSTISLAQNYVNISQMQIAKSILFLKPY